MIKKNILLVTIFLALTSCGYQAILSSQESIFTLQKIDIVEQNNINIKIKNLLKIYQNTKNKTKFYNIIISSNKFKATLSKDSKGDPKILAINITVKINIFENSYSKGEKTFLQSTSYKNEVNKFKLSQYEEKIEENLINKITEEIIIYLHSI